VIEERDLCFIYIPDTFMQVETNDSVHVKRDGSLAELLIYIDLLYRKYLSNLNGGSVLYVMLTRKGKNKKE